MRDRLTDERLAELLKMRPFVVPFAGPESAFTFEELEALITEVLVHRTEAFNRERQRLEFEELDRIINTSKARQ